MDGHDNVAQFTPTDDSIAVRVVQRKDPVDRKGGKEKKDIIFSREEKGMMK